MTIAFHDQISRDHLNAFDAQLGASTIKGTIQPSDADSEERTTRKTDTGDMVRQVTDRIRALKAQLEEFSGFDNGTGEPALRFPKGSSERRALEIQLHHMQSSVLPYTQARAAEMDFKKSTLPSAEQQLTAEIMRRQRIEAAAIKRAEEMEIEDQARRILLQRRPSPGNA